nr:YoaK family protein [Leucobacter edaphi]
MSAVAGYVDAIGFVLSGGLFVSFMSGNSTQAGVEASRGSLTIALLALALIGGFVAGVVAGRILSLANHESRIGERLVTLAVALFGATLLVVLWPDPGYSLTAVAFVMGALNTLFVADGRARIAVTYATGTLVSLGLGVADQIAGRSRGTWIRPLALWLGITVGAVIGAFALAWWGPRAILLASGVLLALGAVQIARDRAARRR